jgi:hypothetical protein
VPPQAHNREKPTTRLSGRPNGSTAAT